MAMYPLGLNGNQPVHKLKTCNKWDEIKPPEDITRNSLATYYLKEPIKGTDPRMKVRYAPTEEQIGDSDIEKLIEERQSMNTFSSVYIKKWIPQQ